MSEYTPVSGSTALKVFAVVSAVLVLVGVGLAAGRWLWPAGERVGVGVTGLAHGPVHVADGVPSGYTRDGAGAASAAAGWQYAVNAAENGQLDPALLIPELAAANPSEALREAVSAIRPSADGQGAVVVPVRITVRSASAEQAVVRVVSCATPKVSGNGLGSGCGTTDLALSWEHEDWKVADRAWEAGAASPAAGEVTGSLPGPLMVFVQ